MTNLEDAKKSDWTTTIATIAGGKAHRVDSRTLLEDAEFKKFNYLGKPAGTEVLPAGTTLYYAAACGTIRSAKWGMSYSNQYRPADEVTCVKCGAKEEPKPERVTAKVGPKWTYVFIDGEQIAEIRTGYHEAFIASL